MRAHRRRLSPACFPLVVLATLVPTLLAASGFYITALLLSLAFSTIELDSELAVAVVILTSGAADPSSAAASWGNCPRCWAIRCSVPSPIWKLLKKKGVVM